ncbi:hypothetical protein HN587_04925 [Candidatus Woesearchaeota archaeon]|jgi:DNA replication initiation complex subunit (GINS family)|nr:hypothetical protein [Candidatus Woesearchaeota archaeon]
MADKDVIITYESLFDILRVEKTKDELQKLDPEFYGQVLAYLKDKRAIFDKEEDQKNLFAQGEKDKARIQLENLRKILKDIYDHREKKILMMAVMKAKTGSSIINATNMLGVEKDFFDNIFSTLSQHRSDILFNLVNFRTPVGILEVKLPSEIEDDLEFLSESNSVKRVSQSESSIPVMETKDKGIQKDQLNSPFKLKITKQVEEVVGPDLEIYGPFNEGDEVELPSELAQVLISKEQAVKL